MLVRMRGRTLVFHGRRDVSGARIAKVKCSLSVGLGWQHSYLRSYVELDRLVSQRKQTCSGGVRRAVCRSRMGGEGSCRKATVLDALLAAVVEPGETVMQRAGWWTKKTNVTRERQAS